MAKGEGGDLVTTAADLDGDTVVNFAAGHVVQVTDVGSIDTGTFRATQTDTNSDGIADAMQVTFGATGTPTQYTADLRGFRRHPGDERRRRDQVAPLIDQPAITLVISAPARR